MMNVVMGDRIDMSYSKALPSTQPNTPLVNGYEKPTLICATSSVEFTSHREEKLVGKAPCSDNVSVVEKTYSENEAASKLYGHESDFVNDTPVHKDLKHRKRASDLHKKDKRHVVAKSKSEKHHLGGAINFLLGKSCEPSFGSADSEHTGQTEPVDDSLKSENNYIVDSQQRASLEAEAKTPSPEARRRMTAPVFYSSPLCLRHPRSSSAPSISRSCSLRSCLKQEDSSSRSSLSSQSCVHFGSINIREYDRRLSDNPAVTDGPPIGIGWQYNPHETEVKVDDYENLHPQRRVKEEFLMPAHVRQQMLISEWGHTMRDVLQASDESKEIRVHREKTLRSSKVLEKLTEALESSKRKFRRLKTGTTKEMEQENLWHDASKWLDADCDEPSSDS